MRDILADVPHKRFRATTPDSSEGFYNRHLRGNWLSHMEMILWSSFQGMAVILEDDIVDFPVQEIIDVIESRPDADMIYFHNLKFIAYSQRTRLSKTARINVGLLDMHAYYVNPRSAKYILEECEKRLTEIENGERKELIDSCIDQFFARVIQPKFKIYATPNLVIQDPKYGTDTGCGKYGVVISD